MLFSFLLLPLRAQEPLGSASQVIARTKSMSTAAAQLEAKGDYNQALGLRREMVSLLEAAVGPTAPDTDAARMTVVKLLAFLGRYAEARQVLNDCLKARIQALGEKDPRVAETLHQLGDAYRREGLLTNSLPWFVQAERLLQNDQRNQELLAIVLNNHALAMQDLQDHGAAEKLFQTALNVLKQSPGGNPTLAAGPLTALGELHRSQGAIAQAETEQVEAVALVTKLPPAAPIRLLVENNLASVYRDEHRWSDAMPIYQRSIEGLSRGRSGADLDLIKVRRNLASCLAEKGEPIAAEAILQECLAALRAAAKTNPPIYLSLLIDLASRQQDAGDLAAARQSFETVVFLAHAQGGTDDAMGCAARERLGSLAATQGDLARARDLLGQALASRRGNAEKDAGRRLDLALSLQDWARFQLKLGRIELAEQGLGESYEILLKCRGDQHPDVAEVLEQRGLLGMAAGRLPEALRFHEAAGRIRTRAFGETNVLVAKSHHNRASVLFLQNDLTEALKESERACALLDQLAGPDYPLTATAVFCQANIRHQQGEWEPAAALYERALATFERQRLPAAAMAARDYGLLQRDRGRIQEAVQLAGRALHSEEARWREVLRFGSEHDRLAQSGFPDLLSLLAAVAPNDPAPMGTAALRLKGAVLDSLIEDRQLATASLDPLQTATLQSLFQARLQRYRLTQLSISGPLSSADDLRQADQAVEALETKLAEHSSALRETRRTFTATSGDIQGKLPSDTALVEYVRYRRWLGPGRTEPCFGALVFQSNALRWVELAPVGGNQGIATLVTNLATAMRANIAPTRTALQETLQGLRERIWDPVAKTITGRPRWIIIAPDGELNFVPFAALWQQDHFLGEDFLFRYVTSARDILAPPFQSSGPRSVDIWAGPDFSSNPGISRRDSAGSNSPLRQPLRGAGGLAGLVPAAYGPLAQARVEGDLLVACAQSNGYAPIKLFPGAAAREATLRSRSAPYLMAFATHATFLPTAAGAPDSLASVNPAGPQASLNAMAWSWLALAGANSALTAWRDGPQLPPEDDGLLTADEIATLNFQGTWLVTLSGCETGVGLVQAGEGVFGLRRAFALAGARHLLLTLWPVWSQETREFMTAFYADALKTGDAPGALARVQRTKLAEWRKARSPVQAVQWTGPFVLNSTGP